MKIRGKLGNWAKAQFLHPKGRRRGMAAVAAVVTTALSATMAPLAFAGGGGGSDNGNGTTPMETQVWWAYRDNNDGGFGGAEMASINNAFAAMNVTMLPSGQPKAFKALNEANTNCQARFNEAHPDQAGQGKCRVVSVGVMTGKNKQWSGMAHHLKSDWMDAWADMVVGKIFSNNNVQYKTSDPFSDQPGTSVNTLVDRYTSDATTVVVIMLNQYEPKIADYHMTVATDQQAPANVQVGSTAAVSDVLHAQASTDIREDVGAHWVLHYDGHPDGYVGAKAAAKDVPVHNHGDTSIAFTPADFGWPYWLEGSYWFDVQIPKQGRMDADVDTPDRDPRETFHVSAVAPPAPVKSVQKGTSADKMANETRISSGTGRGLYELHFVDEINPNGKAYGVEGMKVVDTSDNDRDVSAEFAIAWDKNSHRVTADRDASKGMLPFDHVYELRLTIIVSKPDFGKVTDQAKVWWNHRPGVDTEGKEFPTWKPAPDKSWIKQDATTGKWAAVIDPDHTNSTGADNHVFLDGDKVASVVNGTVASNLVQAPEKFELQDDWSRASYIFKADDASKVRVYQAEAGSETKSSVSDIVNKGKDVTDEFTITVTGKTAVASAKSSYLKSLKGRSTPLQVTMMVPGVVDFAQGKGAQQVRKDFGKAPGEELTFCQAPAPTEGGASAELTNAASETINTHEIATNEPKICGYIPPVKKDVISESSQGGDQSSVDGKVVHPGEKVEYQLLTAPKLPAELAYGVKSVSFTDQYDKYLIPDKQTVEMMDLNTGRVIPKSKYATKWDDDKHLFQLTITDAELIGQWRNSGAPRVQVRFEGTVSKDAPKSHKVKNQWMLTINNSLTPSNEVFNLPAEFNPTKQNVSSKDKTISIDGKTLMMGDTGVYRVTLDAKQTDHAYNVWKLGIIDDFDEEYLSIDPSKIEVLGSDGKDYTKRFNIKLIDGVVYAFAKTVDTPVPATGETVKGDPQPEDMKAYAESDKHDPLKEPAIDQSLLGRTYEVVMPYEVMKVTDGKVVKNVATQVTNASRKTTNEVSNPLKPINPTKDVVVKVNGSSVSGKSIYKDSLFLYQLDSSILPANRAYTEATLWTADDQLNPKVDQYTGQWAVYASRDLYKDGKVLAAKGEKIAGSGFNAKPFGGDLFTLTYDETGKVHVQATALYLGLVSASGEHEVGWRLYIQCKRIAYTERQDNFWVEHYNDKELKSNIVWTRTPNLTPKLHLEKFDAQSGWPSGDRDTPQEALKVKGDTEIIFRITNESATDPDTKRGPIWRAKDIKLEDTTVAGDGIVVEFKYPENWDTLILKPGEHVDVHGTLKGVTHHHTNRAKVSGKPFLPCPVTGDSKPFDPKDSANSAPDLKDSIMIDGVTMCGDTSVDSNTDDWNGIAPVLASTGAAVIVFALLALGLGVGALGFIFHSRRKQVAKHAHSRGTSK